MGVGSGTVQAAAQEHVRVCGVEASGVGRLALPGPCRPGYVGRVNTALWGDAPRTRHRFKVLWKRSVVSLSVQSVLFRSLAK